MTITFKSIFEVLALMTALDICTSEDIKETYIGSFETIYHDVSGHLYFSDDKTLRLENFTYDGKGPATVFWVGLRGSHTLKVDDTGIPIKDENGESNPLKTYKQANFTLTLPDEIHSKNLVWVAVWCQIFKFDFGHVFITEERKLDL